MLINMNLHKRDNGMYYVIYSDRGRQRWRSLRTKDKAVAKRLFNQFKKAYLHNKLIQIEGNTDTMIVDFVSDFLGHCEQKSEHTYLSYKRILKKFVEFTGNVQLKQIKTKTIDDYVTYCHKTLKNSNVTINKDLRHIKSALNKAIEWELLKNNPIKRFLSEDKKPPRALTIKEIEKLLSAAPRPVERFYVMLAVSTGCRRSELCNLLWKHVDFENMTIFIEKSKSHQSRVVPFSDELKEILLQHRGTGKIFNWQPDTVTGWFVKLAKAAEVKCRLHDLRHTYATMLLESCGNIRVVQDILGHSNVTVTEKYAHAVDESKRKAVTGLRIVK